MLLVALLLHIDQIVSAVVGIYLIETLAYLIRIGHYGAIGQHFMLPHPHSREVVLGRMGSAGNKQHYRSECRKKCSDGIILLVLLVGHSVFSSVSKFRYLFEKKLPAAQRDENGITHLSLRKFLKEGFLTSSTDFFLIP